MKRGTQSKLRDELIIGRKDGTYPPFEIKKSASPLNREKCRVIYLEEKEILNLTLNLNDLTHLEFNKDKEKTVIAGGKGYNLLLYVRHSYIVLFFLSNIAYIQFYTTPKHSIIPRIAHEFADFHPPLEKVKLDEFPKITTHQKFKNLDLINRYRRSTQKFPP